MNLSLATKTHGENPATVSFDSAGGKPRAASRKSSFPYASEMSGICPTAKAKGQKPDAFAAMTF